MYSHANVMVGFLIRSEGSFMAHWLASRTKELKILMSLEDEIALGNNDGPHRVA